MEGNQTGTNDRPGMKKKYAVVGAVIVFLLILAAAFEIGRWWGKQEGFATAREALTQSPKTNENKEQTVTPTTVLAPEPEGPPSGEYKSPDGNYQLKLWGPDSGREQGECVMKIYRGETTKIDLKALLGSDKIPCSDMMGNFTSDFVAWGSDGKFVLQRDGGIAVVDINQQSMVLYPTEGVGMNLSRVDRTLNYWLFGPAIAGGKMKYELRNRSGSLLKTIIYPEQNDGYYTVMYDRINNGMLFVTEGPDSEATQKARENNEPVDNGLFWTKFDWLDLNSLSTRTLLKTNPINLGGRGCYGETLESVPGTVIIKMNTAPCILIDSKYLVNGTLRLKL